MNRILGSAVVALALLTLTAPEPASGQTPLLGCGGYGYGGLGYTNFGLLGSPYALGQIPVPPYFALHPPVYYSQPVPRTYGYSPFAYPGARETPEIEMPVEPEVIENPHVEPAVKSVSDNMTARAPLEILNPYVETEGQTKLVGVADAPK